MAHVSLQIQKKTHHEFTVKIVDYAPKVMWGYIRPSHFGYKYWPFFFQPLYGFARRILSLRYPGNFIANIILQSRAFSR